ncbi:MAG: FAD-dependent oxidoreductase [Nitrospirota bacterium]
MTNGSPALETVCYSPRDGQGASVVLGGGLAGLAAGYALTRAARKAVLFEAAPAVGGLSRTLSSGPFLYDIGGHRFFTRDREVDSLVQDLMDGELAPVQRKSKIYMRGKFFDYPLRPANALFGLGPFMVMRILADYGLEKVRGLFARRPDVSLEDWVVRNFGRTMFNIYFKEYSEKVWGIDCSRISQGWVEKRISGLSLSTALRNAFFKFAGREPPTLVDTFLYPRHGIGRIAERFREEIEKENRVFTDTAVVRLRHEDLSVRSLDIHNCRKTFTVQGDSYVSTMPLPALVRMMEPAPPPRVMEAAHSLGFRDLVLVAVKVDRENVTDQTWVYIPERKIPFGRLHEPKVWSRSMAPEGQTLVVVEYFCFEGDATWSTPDGALSETTVRGLADLGFLRPEEVLGTDVVRVPKAYPLFEVGYEEHCGVIYEYLERFRNLHLAGRSGTFQYQNMDHAISSGTAAARSVLLAEARRR